jgi:hypothetical protein
MSDTTDLIRYRSAAHLALCLDMVEEAFNDLNKGHYDLAKIQLHDILDTFEKNTININNTPCTQNIVPFPNPR